MKYVDDFRDGALAKRLSAAIRRSADPARRYRLMEFCGGHTHAVFRYGLADLLPANVELVHGPGCPVCVLPSGRLDMALQLLREHPEVTLASYGDMLRVPGSDRQTLLAARASGADVRMVYSVDDALQLARDHPQREVVFLAIGFETTTPPTALSILAAAREQLSNFSVFCNHVLTPAAMRAILAPGADGQAAAIDGIIGPSHVSVVIGSDAYRFCAEEYGRPVVIAGFEPLDVLQAILMLLRQLNDGRALVENQYTRAVTPRGSVRAQRLCAEVFERRARFEWRGLGDIPDSALAIREAFASCDAERRFAMPARSARDVPGCDCPSVLRGTTKPTDCRLFARACTPEQPLGACMVSSEGACAAYYRYGGWRSADPVTLR